MQREVEYARGQRVSIPQARPEDVRRDSNGVPHWSTEKLRTTLIELDVALSELRRLHRNKKYVNIVWDASRTSAEVVYTPYPKKLK
jgi:hypothetical protein